MAERLAAIGTTIIKLLLDMLPFLTSQRMWKCFNFSSTPLDLNYPKRTQFLAWLLGCPFLQPRQFLRAVSLSCIVETIALPNVFRVLRAIVSLLLVNLIMVFVMVPMRHFEVMGLILLIVGFAPLVFFLASLNPSVLVSFVEYIGIAFTAQLGIASFAQPQRTICSVFSTFGAINLYGAALFGPDAIITMKAETTSIMRFLLMTLFANHNLIIPPSERLPIC